MCPLCRPCGSEIRERLYIASAKRAIFQPEHADVFLDVQEKLTEHWHTEEERVLNEAAREARGAVEQTIKRKCELQEEARKKRGNTKALQLARTAIAVVTTSVGVRFACDGTFRLWVRATYSHSRAYVYAHVRLPAGP